MARLPDVSAVRPAPRPARAIASISPAAAGAVANAFTEAGDKMQRLGFEIQDREATAAAKDADVRASEEIRKLLYDPENGFANLSGQNAIAAQKNVVAMLDRLPDTLLTGLSPRARNKAKDAIASRVERAKQSIDVHASTERRNWINGASAARIEGAYQDSLLNPAETEANLLIMEGEVRGLAAREGWSPEQTDLKLKAEQSRIFRDQALRIAAVDPQAAATYLAANRDKMLGADAVTLETTLIPLAKEHRGRQIGAAVANGGGLPVYDHSVKIDFAMGPNRPHAPSKPILDVIGKSVQDVFGVGARVVVVSGQEGGQDAPSANRPQFGSNRHKTGLAADIAIYRADGSLVKADSPEMAEFARAAAKNGAIGIGFGSEYMGGSHVHVDLVEPGRGQANTWGSGGAAMRDEVVGLIKARRAAGSMSMEDVLAIEDPVERAAALEEIRLATSVRDGQQKAALASAQNAAFEVIENGGRVDDLPLDARTALGQEAMTSLRAYERSVASGLPVETDPAIYMMLRQMEAEDPERFRAMNPLVYADALSQADLKAVIDRQNAPRSTAGETSASTLMSIALNQMQAVGIDTKPTANEKNRQRVATIQTQLLRWQDGVIGATGKPPTASEVDRKVGELLLPVVIDPPGLMNEVDGMAFEAAGFKVDADGLARGTVRIGDTTVPPEVVQEQIAAMQAAGQPVNADTVIARLIELMRR